MTLYELLTELVNRSQWDSEALRRDAYDLIAKLEQVNALGTLTAQMEGADHVHTPETRYFISPDWPVQQDGYRSRSNAKQDYCSTCKNAVGPVIGLTAWPLS